MFAVDIIVIFNSAYHDEEYRIVTDRKIIAKSYLGGWLPVDMLAIMPFDIFLTSQDNYQDIARFIRFGRIYKLVKMTKMLRILKIVKERSKFLAYLNEILQIGLGFERLVFFAFIFFVMAHIMSCFWVISIQFTGEMDNSKSTE
jgi:hypothetical protein